MAGEIRKVETKLEGDSKGLTSEFKKAGKSVKDFEKQAKKSSTGIQGAFKRAAESAAIVEGPLGGVAGRFSTVGASVGRVGPILAGGTIAMGAMTFAMKKSIDAGMEYEKQMNTLTGIIKATGGAAGLTSQEISDFAVKLGEDTLTSAGAVREAAGVVLTFKSITGETFKETLRLSQDMAAAGFGELKTTSLQLAKALEDPVKGLNAMARSGVTFTDSQKDMIKSLVESGQKLKAQEMILAAVRGQVGGAGAAAAGGLIGAIDTLGERWTRVLEGFSRGTGVLGSVTKAVQGLSNVVGDFADMMEEPERAMDKFNTQLKPNVSLLRDYGFELSAIDPENLEEVNRVVQAVTSSGVDLVKLAPYSELQDQIVAASLQAANMEINIGKVSSAMGENHIAVQKMNSSYTAQVERVQSLVDQMNELKSSQQEAAAAPTAAGTDTSALQASLDLMMQMRTPLEEASDAMLQYNALWLSGSLDVETYTRAVQAAFDSVNSKSAESKKMQDDGLVSSSENLLAALSTDTEIIMNSYEERQDSIEDLFQSNAISQKEWSNLSVRNEDMKNQQLERLDKESAQRRESINQTMYQSIASTTSSFLGSIAAMQNQQSRKGFENWKKAATAQAVVDTIAGAQASFKSLAGIPIVGPALGAAAAAAALVSGYVRVRQIRSTSFGGGGGGGGGGGSFGAGAGGGGAGAGGGASPTVSPTSPTAPPKPGQPTATSVSINLGEDDDLISKSAVRRLIDKINEAGEDGALIKHIQVS